MTSVNISATRFLKTERNAVFLLSSIFSLRMLAIFMILPIFSRFAQNLPDATPFRIGLALGIYGLLQALLQAPFGFISDRFGRKPVILLGLAIFTLGSMVVAMSHSIAGITWGRSLQGAGAIGSVMMAWLSDLTREEVRLKAMAILGISIGASFALAFVLGPLCESWMGIFGLFWLMAFLSLLAMGLLYVFLPENPKMPEQTQKLKSTLSLPKSSPKSVSKLIPSFKTNMVAILKPDLLPLYCGVFVIHATLTALFLKLPLAIASFMPESTSALHFYLPIFLAASITTFPILSKIEKVTSHTHTLILSSIILLFSFIIMYGGLQHWIYLSLGLYLFFTIFNVLEASLPSYLSKKVMKSTRGTALGLFSSLQFLGLCLGGILGGLLDEQFGTLAVFAFCVILTLVWLVWVLISHSQLKRFIWHVA